MLKRKTNIFVTILFTFVAFMLIGTTNVNAAEHILVTTEDELIAAVSEQRDTSGTTYVELRNNIALNKTLQIYPIDDLILDLNGYRIAHTEVNVTISILYGIKDNTEGSLTIKDSSEKKTGEIKVYDVISIRDYGQEGVDKHFTLNIEGGKFVHSEGNEMFYLYDNTNHNSMYKSTYDFNVKGGYFEIKGENAKFLRAENLNNFNITLNLKLHELTVKADNTRFIYTNEGVDFTVADVLAPDSRFTVKNSETSESETLLTTSDKETSVTKLNVIKSNVGFEFDTIEITKPWAWSVSDVTYTENVGYDTPKSVLIPICNIGEDTNRIHSVTVDSDNFTIEEGNKIGINSGDTDISWKIKAKTGLAKGTYTATITLTNSVSLQYKATVTLTVVEAKNLGKLKITVPKQINYGDTYEPELTNAITGNTISSDVYKFMYTTKVGNSYAPATATKPTELGSYIVTIKLTDSDYSITGDYPSAAFTIVAKKIEPTVSEIPDQTYTGGQIIPEVSVTYNGTTLTKDVDYKVAPGRMNQEVGEGKITIKPVSGKNYTFDDIEKEFNIVEKTLTDSNVILEPTSFEHTGSEITPAPAVKDGGKTLKKGTDYELSYSNNIDVGENTATVTVTGKGNYTGTVTKNFSIASATTTDKKRQSFFFGERSITKTYGDSNFTEPVNQTLGDGTITYESTKPEVATVDETTGEVTIKKVGTTTIKATASETANYTEATAEYTLTVNKKEISYTATVNDKEFNYITAATVSDVTFNGLVGTDTLAKDTDYTVTADFANESAGENKDVNVIITLQDTEAANNYILTSANYTAKANITPKPIEVSWVTVDPLTYTYTGSAIEPSIIVKDGITLLERDAFYTVEYVNNVNAGTGTIKVTGKDNYKGTVEKEFTINQKSITPTIEDIPPVTYNGSNHTPELVVKDGTTTLVKDRDYTVEYTDNLNAGEADAEITAVSTSNYTFTTTGRSFTINKYTIQEPDVTLEYTSVKVDGTAKEPTVTVKMGTTVIDSLKYNVSYTNNTDIGEADVTVTIKEGDTNFTGSVTVHFNIVDKETVTISGITDNQEFDYDGNPKTPQGTLTVTDNKVDTNTLEVSYAGIDGTSYSSTTAPTEVGTYTVTYKVPDSNENYTGSITYSFKITKIKLSVIFEKTTYTYTGEDIDIELPTSFDFNLMYLTSTTGIGGEVAQILKKAGTYNLSIALKDRNHYEWSDTTADYLPLTLSVVKATPTIEISNLSQKVGSVLAPTYTVTPAVTDGTDKVEYKLSTAEDSTYTETLPTEAGTYNVKVSVFGDKNLNDTSEIATLTITKKTTGGGDGSSSTTTYAITVKENENAEITPNGTVKVEKGADKTFKIKAKEGYEIEDVLVDGKSVGAVSKYTFENVKAKHTLEVKVKKAEEKPTTPEVKETFKDVKKDDWYFEAVEYVAKKGLMNGTGNDMFSPDATTTRGMIVTILYRLEGEPAVEECSFTDVPSDAYYAKAIAWAEKNGIVLGLGEGKFGPDEEITREQLATIMYRYSMYKKYDTSVAEDTNILSYNDIQDLAEYAFTAMQYACGDGLITGVGNGNLAPKGNATRAQLATILMRYCEKYMK